MVSLKKLRNMTWEIRDFFVRNRNIKEYRKLQKYIDSGIMGFLISTEAEVAYNIYLHRWGCDKNGKILKILKNRLNSEEVSK